MLLISFIFLQKQGWCMDNKSVLFVGFNCCSIDRCGILASSSECPYYFAQVYLRTPHTRMFFFFTSFSINTCICFNSHKYVNSYLTLPALSTRLKLAAINSCRKARRCWQPVRKFIKVLSVLYWSLLHTLPTVSDLTDIR